MTNILQRVASPFREFGAGAGFLYTLDRALSRVSSQLRLHVYELVCQPVGDMPFVGRKLAPLAIREIDADDPAVAFMPVRPEIMRERRTQKATCLAAFRNDSLVGYMWFCRPEYQEDEVRCTYVLDSPATSVFDFDFYLLPEHRMGTAFARLWTGVNEHLRAQGVDATYSRLTRFNLESRRAHAHLGAKRVGRALFLKLGKLEIMFATLSPYLSVSLKRRVRLTLPRQ
jgi:hypothetical protein